MKKRAFTLVELLVVIGIIALLVAILIPSLGRRTYEYKENKVTETMYELPIRHVSEWDDAIAEFGRRHTDFEIQTIVRPQQNDWDKKVMVTIRKKETHEVNPGQGRRYSPNSPK